MKKRQILLSLLMCLAIVSLVFAACTTNPKESAVTSAPTAISGITYTGKAQTLVKAGSSENGTLQYKVGDGEYSEALPQATKAGTYTVYYKVVPTDTKAYKESAEASLTVSIAKANLTFTAPTLKTGLTYTGSAQALVTEGSVTGGKIEYKIGSGNWAEAVPTATAVGEYAVSYRITATDTANYNSVEETALGTIKIDETAPTVTTIPAVVENLTYNGNAQTLITAGETANGTIKYSVDDGSTWTETLPTGTNAGEYTVYYKVEGNKGYGDIVKTLIGKVTIAKAAYDMSGIKFENATYPYDGTEKKIEISGTLPSGVTVAYENNTLINAGTQTATAKFTGDTTNYNAIDNMTATLTVNKAQIAKPVADTTTFLYTGSELTYNVAENANYTVSGNKATNAGTTTVMVALKDKTNYEWTDGTQADVTFDFVIAKAANSVTYASTATANCHGEISALQNATATNGTVTYTYSTDGTTYKTLAELGESFKLTVGTFYIKASVAESENYNAAEAVQTVTVSHSYSWTIGDESDVYKCGCGDVSATFNKTVTARNIVNLAETNATLSLTGVSEYASVESISLGETSLGASLTLATSNFTATGEQTLTVVVKDSTEQAHTISVTVLVVTKILNSTNVTSGDDLGDALAAAPKGYFLLGSDISFNAAELGNCKLKYVESFEGTLDGNGYAIRNAKLHYWSGGNDAIFIKENKGTIKNLMLTIVDIDMAGGNNHAGFVQTNNGTIENIYVQCTVSAAYLSDYRQGGVLVWQNKGTVRNCLVNISSADGTALSANCESGAIASYNLESGVIENNYVITDISNLSCIKYSWAQTGRDSNNNSYTDIDAFLAAVTSFDSTKGWNSYWKIEDGKVYFGDTIIGSATPNIVSNGKSNFVIATENDPDSEIITAAEELQSFFTKRPEYDL